MSTLSLRDTIKQFILSNLLIESSHTSINGSDSFLKKGIIDSMGMIQLVTFVQKHYGIRVEPREVVPDNFDSLENIERYIRSKKGSLS